MKNWLDKQAYRMQLWMQGRYGNDELNLALSVLGVIFLLLSLFPGARFFYPPAFVLLLLSCLRCYSKKLARRQAERAAYLRLTGPVRSFFARLRRRWRERGTHRYFRCAQCGVSLRVPRGKGRIRITCPHCGYSFEKRS